MGFKVSRFKIYKLGQSILAELYLGFISHVKRQNIIKKILLVFGMRMPIT
jgi:hypothetical protein